MSSVRLQPGSLLFPVELPLPAAVINHNQPRLQSTPYGLSGCSSDNGVKHGDGEDRPTNGRVWAETRTADSGARGRVPLALHT